MRNIEEVKKELEQVEQLVKEEFTKEHAKEMNGEKANYDEFHKLCRKEDTLKKEMQTINNYNIEVGDGVTIHLYSDAHAGTVIARTKNTLTIQRDKATLKDNWKPEIISGGFVGHCVNQDDQEYDYERDEKGRIYKAYWSNVKGRFIAEGCLSISKGRNEFYDYNF